MGYLMVIDDRGPTRSCDCDRDEALKCCVNVVERLVLDCNLSAGANREGNARKSILSISLWGIVGAKPHD